MDADTLFQAHYGGILTVSTFPTQNCHLWIYPFATL